MTTKTVLSKFRVHCRTGSLEKFFEIIAITTVVHCRTGSLESINNAVNGFLFVQTYPVAKMIEQLTE